MFKTTHTLRRLGQALLLSFIASVALAQTLTIAHNTDPHTLNPFMTNNISVESVILPTVEKLAIFESGEVVPWLLEDWEFIDDFTLRLRLKSGIAFTNGEPLDANAVAKSLYYWREQPVMDQQIAGIEDADFIATSPLEVEIRTKRPVPGLLTGLARYGYVVPPAYYDEVGADGFALHPIGSGPYIFNRHRAGQSVEFSRNDSYWRGQPGFEKVVFRIIPDEFSRAAAIQAGEVDLAYLLSDTTAAQLEGIDGVEIFRAQGLRKFIGTYNAEMPGGEPLLSAEVRRALNYAVDVDTIIDALFDGDALALGGAYALPAEFGYRGVEGFGYDPEKARAMLSEAGYQDGFKVTLAYTVGRYPKDVELGQIIASYLEAVGLTVEQKPLEWGEFVAQRTARTLGHIFVVGLLFTPDLNETFTYMAYGKESRGAPLMTWSDEWWNLYNESLTTVDPERRSAIYGELLEIDRESPHGIYLFAPSDVYAARVSIQGFEPRQDQALFLYDVQPASR